MPAIMDQIGPNHPLASLEGSVDSSTSAPPSAAEDHTGTNAQETSRFLIMPLEFSDWGEIVSPNDPSEGRHPVVEKLLKDKEFVSNNVLMDDEENIIFIITGSNMAGKSTFIRQAALITVMAQMGGFVPAR